MVFPLPIIFLFVEPENTPIYFYESLTQDWQATFSFSFTFSYLISALWWNGWNFLVLFKTGLKKMVNRQL